MELFKLFGTIGLKGVDEAQDAISDLADQAEDSSIDIEGAFKTIGTAVATYFTLDAIKEMGSELVNTAADVSAEVSAFEQIMGDYSGTAQTKMDDVATTTGAVSSRLTPYMTSMTAKFKGLGYDIDDATTLASEGLLLASDAAAFWDKSLDESMGALNSFINGSYEGGESIGLFANDTQLAAYAVEKGLVAETGAWADLNEATKQATRLEYAQKMFEMSGATGQAAKEADQYANTQANLNEKWRQFKAQIGEPILQTIVLPAMSMLSGLVDIIAGGFQAFSDAVGGSDVALQLLAVVIGTITALVIAYNVQQALANAQTTLWAVISGGATAVTTALGAAFTFLTSPLGLIVLAIGAVIAIGVLLVNNWETVKEYAIQIWNSISEFFSGIWESITSVISTAWESICNIIDVAIQFIAELFSLALDIWLIPWNFIWENFGTYLTTAWETIKTTISTAINAIKNVISKVWNAIKNFITPILNTIKTTFSNVWNGIKTTVTNVVNGIKTTISNVWNGIKTTISNIINGIKTTISNVFNGLKTTVSTIWEGIKSAITGPIEKAKEIVGGIIDTIKGFFNFEWELPKLKLPHFAITPSDWGFGDLLEGVIPELGIEWYAKGGILERPTVFGTRGNSLMVGGEAGPEAIAPIDTLLGMINQAVATQMQGLAIPLEAIEEVVSKYLPLAGTQQLVLDSGVLIGELTPSIDKNLGELTTYKRRGVR